MYGKCVNLCATSCIVYIVSHRRQYINVYNMYICIIYLIHIINEIDVRRVTARKTRARVFASLSRLNNRQLVPVSNLRRHHPSYWNSKRPRYFPRVDHGPRRNIYINPARCDTPICKNTSPPARLSLATLYVYRVTQRFTHALVIYLLF